MPPEKFSMNLTSIQKTYRRASGRYNLYFGRLFHPGRKTVVDLLESKPGDRILEVGVGTGLSLPLYSTEVKVTGIDISPEMLAKAQALVKEDDLKHVEALHVMNAEEMAFKDNSFDSVIAMYVATVVPSPKKFVEEMRRVCKPGGRIVILNHFADPKTIAGKAASMLAPFSQYLGWRPHLTLADFQEQTGLQYSRKIRINVFNMWTILVVENQK